MKLRYCALLACCIALTACEDDLLPPTTISSSLSFSYTGAGTSATTSYSATGTIPSNISTSFGSSAWAAGSVHPTANYVVIGASVPKTTTTWDLTSIGITRKTTGSAAIDPTCDEDSTTCTGVFIFFGKGQNDLDFAYACQLTSGTVTISAITSSRATGTFSGTGTCATSAGAISNFSVSNGSFDVVLTSQLL